MKPKADTALPSPSLSSRRKRLSSLRWQLHCKREAAAEHRRKAELVDGRVAELQALIDQLAAELVDEDPSALDGLHDVGGAR